MDFDQLMHALKEHGRRRVDYHSAEKRLTLQIKGICRRLCNSNKDQGNLLYADLVKNENPMHTTFPLFQSRNGLEASRKEEEKLMEKYAKQLPVYKDFVEPIRGAAALGLAQIIGEAGDLSNYSNPAKLWKRFGLGVIDNLAQQRIAGDKELAIKHGYSPRRRSLVWNIGGSLIKLNGEGKYRQIYDARKAYEVAKAQEQGFTVVPAAQIPKKDSAKYRSEGHVHNRAQRFMEKQYLKDLWVAWNWIHKPELVKDFVQE